MFRERFIRIPWRVNFNLTVIKMLVLNGILHRGHDSVESRARAPLQQALRGVGRQNVSTGRHVCVRVFPSVCV